MAKREHNAELGQSTPSVSGYVSHMSPKKTNNKCFKFVLQTSPETCESAICFDESKKRKVKEYYDSGSPVKFLNIKRNTEKKKTYLSDTVINKMSTITSPNKSEVAFNFKQSTPSYTTVQEVNNLEDGIMISIKGVLDSDFENVVNQKCKDGSYRRMLEGSCLRDKSGCIGVTLWEDAIDDVSVALESGKHTFSIANVKVKEFMGILSLTTTSDTVISVIGEEMVLNNTEVAEVPAACFSEILEVGKIALVSNFARFFICQNCPKKLTELITDANAECHFCGTLQRVADCQSTFTVKLKPTTEGDWYTLFEYVLRDGFPELPDNINGSAVYEFLLSVESVMFQVDKRQKVIKEFKRIEMGEEKQSEGNLMEPSASQKSSSDQPEHHDKQNSSNYQASDQPEHHDKQKCSNDQQEHHDEQAKSEENV